MIIKMVTPTLELIFWEDWERPVHVTFLDQDKNEQISFNAGTKIFGVGVEDKMSNALFHFLQEANTAIPKLTTLYLIKDPTKLIKILLLGTQVRIGCDLPFTMRHLPV